MELNQTWQIVYEKHASPKTSFRILDHLRFQKFRYHGENRPGKKNQKKEFMKIEISNLPAACVRVCIICVDADVQDKVKVHPNGLIGLDCHDGLYDMRCSTTASMDSFQIVIPYIRIERMKSKKESKDAIMEAMKTRMSYIPSPYKEYFTSQCPDVAFSKDVDTAKVRLAVIVSVEGSSAGMEKPLSISNVIKDGCQNTSLDILKISQNHVPASSGACVDIFTTDNSPAIKPGEYNVYVTYQPPGASGKLEHWISQETTPGQDCILYNKVITYKVPPFEPDLFLKSPVKATLHLECPDSDLSCSCPFYYVPERGGTEFPANNDEEEMNCIRLRRKQSVKRTRCESGDNSEITASLRMKPICKGSPTGQVRSNRVTVPEPDLHPLTIDTQQLNVKITAGTNSESRKPLHLQPAVDTDDSKYSDNIWSRSTSARNDDQKAIFHGTSMKTENRITQTKINIADYQTTGSSTFGLFSSDNPNIINKQQNNFGRDMGVASRVQSMPSCSIQRPDSRVEMGVTSGVQSMPSCNNQRPDSRAEMGVASRVQSMPSCSIQRPDSRVEMGVASRVQSMPSCSIQRPDSRVEMGVTSGVQSMPSYSVQRPGCNAAIIPGCETKPVYTNSQFPNNYQFVPQSAALRQDSCSSLSYHNRTEHGMPQNSKSNQHTVTDLIEYTKWQQETTARPQDSYRTCWVGQKQTGKCISDLAVDNEKAQAVSDIVKYLQDTRHITTDNGDIGQISCDFLTNPDYHEASSVNQAAPTATPDHAGAYTTSFNLGTMDLFAETAANLSTMDLLKCLTDNY